MSPDPPHTWEFATRQASPRTGVNYLGLLNTGAYLLGKYLSARALLRHLQDLPAHPAFFSALWAPPTQTPWEKTLRAGGLGGHHANPTGSLPPGSRDPFNPEVELPP